MQSVFMSLFFLFVLFQVVLPGLKTLFQENHQVYVLKCWGALVQLFGKVTSVTMLHLKTNLFAHQLCRSTSYPKTWYFFELECPYLAA